MDSIDRELALFDATLAALPRIVVGNKIDLAESRANLARVEDAVRSRGAEFRAISATTSAGVAELVALLCERLLPAGPESERAHSAAERS
jgi:GTPase involved in cell partitioning and DNA repair